MLKGFWRLSRLYVPQFAGQIADQAIFAAVFRRFSPPPTTKARGIMSTAGKIRISTVIFGYHPTDESVLKLWCRFLKRKAEG